MSIQVECTVDSRSARTWSSGNSFRLRICVGNANALNDGRIRPVNFSDGAADTNSQEKKVSRTACTGTFGVHCIKKNPD